MKDADSMMRNIRKFRLHLARFFKDVFAESELNLPQYSLLAVLDEQGEATMTELTRALGLTMGAGTNLVDRLVRAGLAERKRNTEDRRIVKVQLTPEGSRVLHSVLDHSRTIIADVLVHISSEDRAAFLRVLGVLVDRLEQR